MIKGWLLLSFLFAVPCWAGIIGKDLVLDRPIEVKGGKQGTVVVFLSARCPCSHSHIRLLSQLAMDFKDFNFVGVHSNADEPPSLSRPYFQNARLPFPVIEDADGRLADQFKALKTPHAFVVSLAGETLYKGGVTSSNEANLADRHYLQEALKDINLGIPVKTAEGRTLGCLISRSKKHAW